jgi:DNA-binding protein HU-beta
MGAQAAGKAVCYSGLMHGQVLITSGFPSAAKAAKKLGVSKKIARGLSLLAKHSLQTGEFVLPGVGRIVRLDRRARTTEKPAARGAIEVPAKRVVRFRVANATKDALVPPKKK